MDNLTTHAIIIGIISSLIMPFLLVNCYRDLSVRFDFEFNENNTPKYFFVSLVIWLIFYPILWITIDAITVSPYEEYEERHRRLTTIQEIQEIDSIDLIIKERAKTKFNNTIFAGIEFGDSEEIVTKKLKKYKQTFGDVIYADSSTYAFKITALEYYNDKLHTLVINLGSIWIDRKDLWKLYRLKYGETKYNDWEWSDAIIDYSEKTDAEEVWDRKGYNDRVYYYYNNDYSTITETPYYYSVIKYQSKAILAEKAEDQKREYKKEKEKEMREDSIRKAKILEKKKRAKEISDNSITPI